jgi:hypothetical protein
MKTVFGWTVALVGWAVSFSPAAHAYPENVRHGYVNCAACHIHPQGGGQLNAYGRQLSKALQSNGKFFFEPGQTGMIRTRRWSFFTAQCLALNG